MALLTQDYYCPALGMASELRIQTPEAILRGEEKPRGTLFLLPPEGESGLSLLTGTKLAALCEEYRVTALIPPCLQGCYTDMAFGYPFYQSLKFVREYIGNYLPGLAPEKGRTAIAGFGIGGFAALRWALEEPEFFFAAGSIAGRLDPAMAPQGYFTEKRLSDLFGTPEERLKKRGDFLSLCETSPHNRLFLFSAREDPGFESTLLAAKALGAKAKTATVQGAASGKVCSDALGEFFKFCVGGDS